MFEDVRKVQVAFFLKHWSEIKKSETMTQIWQQIRVGKHIGFEEGELGSGSHRARADFSLAFDRGPIGVQAGLRWRWACMYIALMTCYAMTYRYPVL